MKMRQVTAVAMATMMVAGLGTSVQAQTVTSVPKEESQNVQATYNASTEAGTVYSVDITWGSLEYKYTVDTEGVWDPEKHEYTGAIEGAWSAEDGADKITVTNHSNAAVKAELKYEQEDGYNAVTGSFNQEELYIETAEGTEKGNAPKKEAKLTLEGKLNKGVDEQKVGTATVTISAAE